VAIRRGDNMEKRGLSLAEIQEVPKNNLILLAGPPGAGKSTFCYQVVLNGLAMDRPVIFVTTEQGPGEIIGLLREGGLGEVPPGALSFVDAFGETVGVTTPERPDTTCANCEDLNSISMAIARQQGKIGRKDVLVAFDSLTSPYLFNREEVFRFMRLCLLKFTAQGNSVLALMDEGCGKEEDLVAMMTVADGIIRTELREDSRVINVVKHPIVAPGKIETPLTWSKTITVKFDPRFRRRLAETAFLGGGKTLRPELGDFVNIFWRNLISWSGMLWDPKRFPTMAYELAKELEFASATETLAVLPWRMKLLFKLLLPKNFSEPKNAKKCFQAMKKSTENQGMQIGEYVEDASKKDEHYIKAYESYNCWGLDSVGARLAFQDCGLIAGSVKAMEKEERDWNAVETKCIGLGDPYCEYKVMPGEIDGMKGFLEGIDSSIVEKIHDRMMDQLVAFLIHNRPLGDRPTLGSGFFFPFILFVTYPSLLSERYRMALRMGGAKVGKEVGEHLMDAGLGEDEAIDRVVDLMNYCKVGRVTLGETIRMTENSETFGLDTGQLSCFFTTGFLNGLFSTVKNQHVREMKCIAAGDPFCEWEIR
jgi:predicted hydrocarbon binding protein/KaiC/GvpD/RAD55 family RecA-like ATPase